MAVRLTPIPHQIAHQLFLRYSNSAFTKAWTDSVTFLIDPLLSVEYVEREKNAVHSEYQMQIKDDGWRGYMVSKLALNLVHPGLPL